MARNAVESINLSPVKRPSLAQRPARSPPQATTADGLRLAIVGDDHALERTVKRRQHAALDEIECGRLTVARPRQIARDLLIYSARMRTHHHNAVGKHHRLF